MGLARDGVLAVAAAALAVRKGIRLGPLEWATLLAVAGLCIWTLLSATWAASPTWAIREAQRTLVYVSGLFAMLLLVRQAAYRMLVGGAFVGVTVACCYGLATRLFPGWQSTFDSFGGYRLSEPIGYWNGLGIIAAMGVLLAIGIAAKARLTACRAFAAASAPFLVATLYFTYSRGSWIALGLGFVASAALDRRRLQLVTTGVLVGAWSTLAVALSSRSRALTHVHATRVSAAHDGRLLAVELGLIALAAALTAAALGYGERRLRIPRTVRLVYSAGLALLVVVSLTAAVTHYGGPSRLVQKGYDSLSTAPPYSANLNKRLFNLSSPQRINTWRVAWTEYRTEPFLGTGAGTYEAYWMKERPNSFHVRNAHNLYLETLATLGPSDLFFLAFY